MTRTRAFAVAVGAVVLGCHGGNSRPKELTIDELATMLHSDRVPKVYDANGDMTRDEYGVIPGAVLLSGSGSYPLDVLPSDKTMPIVFYCASTWCGAAESAARRAMAAGHQWVGVLPDGIKGWARAGMPVTRAH